MNNLNIPLYRGFSKTFNKYILGIPYFSDGRYYMLVDDCNKNNDIGTGSFPIDETTLAINFNDMLDSQGSKIFASLSEDRKGGDILEYEDVKGTVYIDIFTYSVKADTNQGYLMPHVFINSKVIGIQK